MSCLYDIYVATDKDRNNLEYVCTVGNADSESEATSLAAPIVSIHASRLYAVESPDNTHVRAESGKDVDWFVPKTLRRRDLITGKKPSGRRGKALAEIVD